MNDIGKIGVVTFADQAQALLGDYLRAKYYNACADASGLSRMCLVHSGMLVATTT